MNLVRSFGRRTPHRRVLPTLLTAVACVVAVGGCTSGGATTESNPAVSEHVLSPPPSAVSNPCVSPAPPETSEPRSEEAIADAQDIADQYLGSIATEAGQSITTGGADGDRLYVGLTGNWCTHRDALRAATGLSEQLLVFAVPVANRAAQALADRIFGELSELEAQGVTVSATGVNAYTGYTEITTPRVPGTDVAIRRFFGLSDTTPLEIRTGQFRPASPG